MPVSTSRRLAGITNVTIDGNAYDIVGDAEWCASTVKRETLTGQTRVEGYSEMPVAGWISMTLRDNQAFSVQALNQLTDVTVQLDTANGKSVYGNGMWSTEVGAVKTAEGSFPIRFEGDDVYEGGVLT